MILINKENRRIQHKARANHVKLYVKAKETNFA